MSILAAKFIKEKLSVPSIKSKVGDRIYLHGLDRDTDFPFIVYNYSISASEGTKDYDEDICSTDIYVFDTDGIRSLELAETIRKELSHKTASYAEFEVTDTEFQSYDGQLDEGVYAQHLSFNIITD